MVMLPSWATVSVTDEVAAGEADVVVIATVALQAPGVVPATKLTEAPDAPMVEPVQPGFEAPVPSVQANESVPGAAAGSVATTASACVAPKTTVFAVVMEFTMM